MCIAAFLRTIDAPQCNHSRNYCLPIWFFFFNRRIFFAVVRWQCIPFACIYIFNSFRKFIEQKVFLRYKFINLKTEIKKNNWQSYSQWCSQFSFHLDFRTRDEFLKSACHTHTQQPSMRIFMYTSIKTITTKRSAVFSFPHA